MGQTPYQPLRSPSTVPTVDGSEIPNNHLGCFVNPANNGKNYHINRWSYRISEPSTVSWNTQGPRTPHHECKHWTALEWRAQKESWYITSNNDKGKSSTNTPGLYTKIFTKVKVPGAWVDFCPAHNLFLVSAITFQSPENLSTRIVGPQRTIG